jgi:hypothetical protein
MLCTESLVTGVIGFSDTTGQGRGEPESGERPDTIKLPGQSSEVPPPCSWPGNLLHGARLCSCRDAMDPRGSQESIAG